ncbi:hypothetical protein [Terracoccus luteus]|uniref:Uncharacterized protein n=1 Tax=Terracoccus luteus TaxID=53356 RepID=A0A495Y0B3_9MICO|nr:hypothetical protein [Terracoccus luteus]MBB2986092.1 hypothetical protein [Terracoccus luteus]MCP2171744.1 hypothetical protein [Terracoccus luteus]RKT78855.1 hypothetical protein DFJ68_2309 [Terracoccus luteus]
MSDPSTPTGPSDQQTDQQSDQPGADDLPEPLQEGDGDGIELTTGEPNTFEPEEDPDAADA